MKEIAIFGASGHGKVVADLAEILGYKITFFDDEYPQKKQVEHWDVNGTFNDLLLTKDIYKEVVVAIGNNNTRYRLSDQLIKRGFKLPVLIHPSSIISKYALIDAGTVVFANVVINAFAQIGTSCIINTGAIVEHDCILGHCVHLSPNVSLAGGTIIGERSWLGIASVTNQLINIGKCVTVGANSTVISDISSNSTVVGSPAIGIQK